MFLAGNTGVVGGAHDGNDAGGGGDASLVCSLHTHPANNAPQASLKLCREMRLDTLRTWMAGYCSALALKLNRKPRSILSALLGVLQPDPLAAKLSDENLSDGEV